MAELPDDQLKIASEVISHHDQLKDAFHQLKSYIESVHVKIATELKQVNDAFSSLEAPLSKLNSDKSEVPPAPLLDVDTVEQFEDVADVLDEMILQLVRMMAGALPSRQAVA